MDDWIYSLNQLIDTLLIFLKNQQLAKYDTLRLLWFVIK